MVLKKRDDGVNQFEAREGLKNATAATALNMDPMDLAIVGPKPKTWPKFTVTIGEAEFEIDIKNFVGPHDSFDASNPCYSHTFDWNVKPGHIKIAFAMPNPNAIVCRHLKGEEFATVNEGRHRVLVQRVVNWIKTALGKPPTRCKVLKGSFGLAESTIITEMSNRRYQRDRAAEIEQNLHVIEQNGWDDAVAADYFDVKPATIRSWRHRAKHGTPKHKPAEGAGKMLTRPTLRKMLKRARSGQADVPGVNNTLATELLEVIVTGKLPEGASKKIVKLCEGIV